MKKSINEKIVAVTGRDNWSTAEACGLPSLRVSDGPHGLRFVTEEKDGEQIAAESVCYPTLSALGNSFDESLVYAVGQAIAEDCIKHDVAIILGPGVNLKRTPLCGRNFEYFSEDGVLAGKLAAAYIEGVQSKGIGTSLKHFAANNREYDRFFQSSEMDERTLRETYCRAFEIAMKAKPWTVMCSYNPVNGVYASENKHLLKDILRNEFGFDGVIVSDWGAVKHRAKSLKAGIDLAMPYSADYEKQLTDWYEKGLIGEDDLDRSVGRLRELAEKYRSAVSRRRATMTEEQKHELAVRTAEESAVLLKNDDDILPVCRDKRIAVIGGFAETPEFQGGGSSRVNAKVSQSLCDCLKRLGFNVDFALGYMIRYNIFTPFGIRYAVETAAKNDCAVVCVGNTWLTEKEETDRFSLKLNPAAEDLILGVAQVNPNVIVVIYAGSAVDVSAFEGKVKAILYMGYCGEGANEAAADLISGMVSPCGKLAETFPKSLEDTATADRRGNGYSERYPEGVLVGYKYYEYNGIAPAYPFGYGLSYTTFRYGDLNVKKLGETDYYISFSVKNVGRHAASEIVQVYIADDASMVTRPRKELVAFGKKHLEVGETCTFGFNLTERDFAYFSPVLNEFYVENGTFTILIGASSADIRLQEKVEIKLPDEKQFSRY